MSCSISNQEIRKHVEEINQVLKYADESRRKGILTDVCIKAGNKSFLAHRLILSCYSMFFRTMFQTNMKEKYAYTVTIEGVDETFLESLIEFIYTRKISINQENVFDLLAASDYLQIGEAKQFCFDFLSNIISVETCLEVLNTADLYQNNNLVNKTVQFIAKNFATISSQNNFTCQSKNNLIGLLSKLHSNRVDERLFYDAIIRWMKYDESRDDNFAELFQHLYLNKFSSSFLVETISTETFVIRNLMCSNLVVKALAMKLQELVSTNPSKILCLGGQETLEKMFVVHNDDKKVYPALPYESYAQCSLQLDDFVYCIGGGKSFSSADKVWRMKLYEANMGWEEVSSMKFERKYFGAAVYKNEIAVAGGWSHDECANKSAEFYNVIRDQWSVLPSMNEGKYSNILVTCDDSLFCLGGYSGYRHISTVEKLCDVNGTWQHVKPMQTPRSEFAAVSCMNAIYAIGGRNNQDLAMKSVEKYDSDSNTWIYVKEINVERCGHSACVMHDKIFVVGGKNTNNEFASEIECYDPLDDKWYIVGNTNKKLVHHSIVAI